MREQVNATMMPKLRAAVQALADQQHRTFSNMLECLIALGLRGIQQGEDIGAELAKFDEKPPAPPTTTDKEVK